MVTTQQKVAGLILSVALFAASLLHVYWALGGTWALEESIGEGNPLPPGWSIWLVAGGLVMAALGILGQIELWGRFVSRRLLRAGTWILFVSLVAVTILNAFTGRFWEMVIIAPFCAVLALLTLVVARVRSSQ